MKLSDIIDKHNYKVMVSEFERNGLPYSSFLTLDARKKYFLSKFWKIGAKLSFLTGFVNTFFLLIIVLIIELIQQLQTRLIVIIGVLFVVFYLNDILKDYKTVFEAYVNNIIDEYKEVEE